MVQKRKIVRKKIKQITISGNNDVYDLKTSKNHNFFANNILIHNCGEIPLIPFGCCQLSAMNIWKFIKDGDFNWEKLYKTSKQIMVLMDNVIDKMDYPDERFKDVSIKYRQVGIGMMGLSDTMFELDIKYDSLKGKEFAGKVMKTITMGCMDGSCELPGNFYNYDIFKDDMEEIASSLCDGDEILLTKIKNKGLRNSYFTTCAPTGTTAISCDASYGIEPCFG